MFVSIYFFRSIIVVKWIGRRVFIMVRCFGNVVWNKVNNV